MATHKALISLCDDGGELPRMSKIVRKLAFVSLVVISSACSTHDKGIMTDFVPTPGGFHFVARAADLQYPEDDPHAESIRIKWLESYLADNDVCSGGYEISERRPILQTTSLIGIRVYRVHYYGYCL